MRMTGEQHKNKKTYGITLESVISKSSEKYVQINKKKINQQKINLKHKLI